MKTPKQIAAEALANYFLQQAVEATKEIASWPEERRHKACEEADRMGPPPELVKEFRKRRKSLRKLLKNFE